MTPEMREYLFWDREISAVEECPVEHLHRYLDARGTPRVAVVQPSDDELRRASSRLADLWAGFDDFERALVLEAVRRRDEGGAADAA